MTVMFWTKVTVVGICKLFRKGNPQNLETEKCEIKRSKLRTF